MWFVDLHMLYESSLTAFWTFFPSVKFMPTILTVMGSWLFDVVPFSNLANLCCRLVYLEALRYEKPFSLLLYVLISLYLRSPRIILFLPNFWSMLYSDMNEFAFRAMTIGPCKLACTATVSSSFTSEWCQVLIPDPNLPCMFVVSHHGLRWKEEMVCFRVVASLRYYSFTQKYLWIVLKDKCFKMIQA